MRWWRLPLLLGMLGACLEPLKDECDPQKPASCPAGSRCEKWGPYICVAAKGGGGGTGGSGGTTPGGSGGGGTGGSAGSGGTGPTYTLSFEALPTLVGAQLDVTAVATGAPDMVTLAATLGGSPLAIAAPSVSGNRYTVHLDLSAAARSDDQELVVTARVPDTDVTAQASTRVDNQPPRLTLPQLPQVVRNRPVVFQLQVADAHATGADVQAQLTEKGAAPGAAWGAPGTSAATTADFSLDQKALPLPAFTGTFTVHARSTDSLGNAAEESADVSVTRLAWKTSVGGKVTTAPALLADGRVVVVTDSTSSENVRLLDAAGGDAGRVRFVSQLAFGPSASRTFLYVPDGKTLHILDPAASLADRPCLISDASEKISSPAALASPSGSTDSYVIVSTASGALTNVIVRAGSCALEESVDVADAYDANRSVPTILDIEGDHLRVAVGATNKRGVAVHQLSSRGDFAFESPELLPADASTVHLPIAIAASEIFVAPENFQGAWRLAYSAFTAQPTITKAAAGTSFTAAPAVNDAVAIYPSDAGLSVFDRIGDWSRPTATAIAGGVSTTPVLGADGLVYAVGKTGSVHAYALAAGALTERWSGAAGGTITSSPLLTCDGLLIFGSSDQNVYAIATDAPGLDATAAWPRYQHDNASTGNTSTPNTCP